ncbi:MAG TPA: UDP-N-acetylmuramoyl-L-alanine--D-glutamate ligase [Acidimicrobiales bacterium]|nr:UDP-N-acetylmuramoyl-L-alanine--D-glutamate ligase [Acidimicrobiales bacterium]
MKAEPAGEARATNGDRPAVGDPRRILVVGMGITGRAVADSCLRRDMAVRAADDRPTDAARIAASDRGIDLVEAPDVAELEDMVLWADVVVPSPGVPRGHAIYTLADRLGVPLVGELDLAASWDDRPIVAVTGTNGKTTVTTLIASMLQAGGHSAVAAGNTEIPLVEAIDRDVRRETEWFVVEASSFRLERARLFHPRVAVWLNLAPDHLDWHGDIDSYRRAKSRIWALAGPGDTVVVPMSGPEIQAEALGTTAEVVGFGEGGTVIEGLVLAGQAQVVGGWIVDQLGRRVVAVDQMARHRPHDVANALAAVAAAAACGVEPEPMARVLRRFEGLPHRLMRIARSGGVDWYDDSKATTPEAAVAAVSGFESVVLLAGGSDKGLDLAPLLAVTPRIRALVAMGETAPALVELFSGTVPVVTASDMAAAVEAAGRLAMPGDAVLLSPACASFDAYRNYAERGDEFIRIVARTIESMEEDRR